MRPDHLLIKDFTYPLPEEKIARHPLQQRDSSKLLVYQKGAIIESSYAQLHDHVDDDSLMIFNNTRVVEARLIFTKESGGQIEIFCLAPAHEHPDISMAMAQKQRVLWECMVGGASKWKSGLVLKIEINNGQQVVLEARMHEKKNDSFLIDFSWTPTDLSFSEVLHEVGSIPLPPYLNRQAAAEDKERYQTVYALHDGSVAAPTAGLHFTDTIFGNLSKKNIAIDYVTLHVGAGTFKPVKTAAIADHDMHAEVFEVSLDTLQKLLASTKKNIIAVGTTSLRTLESLYWLGLKTLHQPNIAQHDLTVSQWEPYENEAAKNIETSVALSALEEWMQRQEIAKLVTRTSIMIAPGYRLKVAKGLVTNFHQPQSTLLLLIAAIIGDKWKEMYQYALDHDFRFLSYGDGCLLLPDL